jgi:hypothetical protein
MGSESRTLRDGREKGRGTKTVVQEEGVGESSDEKWEEDE